MPLACLVPISTAVVEPHPAGVTGGECRDGVWVIDLEALPQDHGARLSWPRETFLHWGPRDTIEVQELSALGWPLRYGVTTAPGWYADERGRRHAWVPGLKGWCLKRQVSQVTRRAGGFWSMRAGSGCRRAAWRLDVLGPVVVSQAASDRGSDAVAAGWPSADASIEALNRQQPRTAGHFEGSCPRGRQGPGVLVWRDAYGRRMAPEAVDAAKAAPVPPFLRRLHRLGLQIQTVDIDHGQALRQALTAVDPEARLPYDYCPSSPNLWRKWWTSALAHRRARAARRHKVRTPWSRDHLAGLAHTRWKKRSLLCKSDERRRAKAPQPLGEIMAADPKIGRLRAFMKGVWPIFRHRPQAPEAQAALAALQKITIEPTAPRPLQPVFSCWAEPFEAMLTYLKQAAVQRPSLAESGMRLLRRLAVEPDGFRTPTGREHGLKMYQAVKYLGWSVYNPHFTSVG